MSEQVAQQWRELCDAFASYSGRVNKNTSRTIGSASLKDETKHVAQMYFGGVRRGLQQLGLTDLVEQLSIAFEALIVLSEGRNLTSSYKKHTKAIRRLIPKVTSQVAMQSGPVSVVSSSENDQKILKTLSDFIPSAALSYQQAIVDMAEGSRLSFRGPAHELRESLREVLDHLAPSEDMEKGGVKIEKDQKKYTMKQKVRFIFKARERSMIESAVPENAANTIDELIASMTRSTYDRGSLSAHQERGKKACDQLKRYVDVVLHDLLEI